MDERTHRALFLSASERLKRAFQEEELKPCYAPLASDPFRELWIARALRREHPEAFDLDNPGDLIFWAFASD